MTGVCLALDASAGPASVALCIDGVCVQSRRIDRQGSAELLAPTVQECLASAGLHARELTDVIVGGGPGSFTGLRVAAAFAKGLVRGANATLHAVPSLALTVGSLPEPAAGEYIAVLDALRGEWFAQSLCRGRDGAWTAGAMTREPIVAIRERAESTGAQLIGPPIDVLQQPDATAAMLFAVTAVSRDTWEPDYGRLAEAQVKWEEAHARALPTS
jgi:tRNA threonylcarbamoyladenosine biosynthesis protein TsaB